MAYKVLDLYCKAGGSAQGLKDAWADAEIVGVDIEFQKNYPFTFVLGDALNPPFDLREFDFIWASPVCKGYTPLKALHKDREYPRLIRATRKMLDKAGRPWVMENVSGARDDMRTVIELCGTMFGLKVYRHRRFESNMMLMQPSHLPHRDRMPRCCNGKNGKSPNGFVTVAGHSFRVADGIEAMKINWMTGAELSQAIPPAYSEFIAKQIRP